MIDANIKVEAFSPFKGALWLTLKDVLNTGNQTYTCIRNEIANITCKFL